LKISEAFTEADAYHIPLSAEPGVLTRALGPVLISDACQLFDERGLAKLTLMASEIESLTRAVQVKPLANPQERNELTELRSRWKIAFKELESLRTAQVGPLNDRVKAINSIFKRILEPGLAFDQSAERALLAYLNAERDRERREHAERDRLLVEAAAAQARAEAAAAAATTDKARDLANIKAEVASRVIQAFEAQAPRPAATRVRTDSGSTFVTRRKIVTVVAPELVPREWCCPDVKRIEKAALSGVQIPGVIVEEVEGLTVRNA
jgi:hypothetical protein